MEPKNIKCSDNISYCPNGYTCCPKKGHTGYGCCKGLSAVCCDDMEHCCQENTTCDIDNGTCKKKVHLPLLNLVTATEIHSLRSIVCPDGKTLCDNGNTCCSSIVPGTYACCPKPEATCCSDKTYCCPYGYSCDPNTHKCSHSNAASLFTKVRSPVPLKMKNICPDGSTVCGLNSTCCMHTNKSWACCPAINAVCCSDGNHCCPENHTCDKINFTCKKITSQNQATSLIKIRK